MEENTQSELHRLIGRAEAFQQATGLTHAQFSTRYAEFVGSHKSWEFRLVARKWDELKLATWLPKLRKFVARIDGASQETEIFDALPIVKHANYLFDTLQTRANDRRCAILLGPQGTGKTLALRHVQRSNKFAPLFLSANETWKDSRMRIAAALAGAVNAPLTSSASQTFHNAVDVMRASPVTLLIDEAHEGGVLLMKLVKTIINDTGSRIMLSIYPTAWNRLLNGANDAYAEAQQLLRRTLRPVKMDWLAGLTKEDLKAWSAAVKLPGLAARAEDALPSIRRHGNYSVLSDALDRARIAADEHDEDVTPDLVLRQIKELCGLSL
jgi:hypothetical protein